VTERISVLALDVVAGSLADLQAQGISSDPAQLVLREREAWVGQLEERRRANVTIRAYRGAIEDLLAWAQRRQCTAGLFEEQAILDYLEDYQQRCQPARVTFLHRFVILRTFMQWVSRRHGTPDPFLALKPPRTQRGRNWLTRDEFLQILKGAEHPARNLAGIVERDRLVLLAIIMAGLGRYELMAARWADINLNTRPATLEIHAGPGRRPRTQPLPVQLRAELQRWHELREHSSTGHVFCGLKGGRLQTDTLEQIIARAASRGGLEKNVSAGMLRQTGAVWLRERGAAAWLTAEYLAHTDSPTTRYGHKPEDMRAALQGLADYITKKPTTRHRTSPPASK
jgi:integrase/recombinase XerD